MFDLYEKLLDIFLTAFTIFYATLIVGIVCAFLLLYVIEIDPMMITLKHVLGFLFGSTLITTLAVIVTRIGKDYMRWTRFYFILTILLSVELGILALIVVGGLFYTLFTN